VAAEAPPLPYGGDEIGQVGHAFNALQRTTVIAAVAEADLRRGVNEVFLNIARRSQTLLHRQLSILDTMERRADDPVELADLFRIDHLATRMRRHAEDLVILAGAAPGRGWRLPVPLVDVLRGGVSEVEDYARVIVRPVPDIAVTGRAVGDIIHLLAELIENATAFSPPSTKVTVGAEPVTHGLAVEIDDRGIGISADVLQELNERLATPPDFTQLAEHGGGAGEAGGGAQLGLFVVARLAARHGVQVALQHSAYGGTTAVVLVPDTLLAPSSEQLALPAGPSAPGELVPLSSGSPHAPRSEAQPRSGEGRASRSDADDGTPANATTIGFTPVPGHGDPLPSRRPGTGSQEDDPSVIVATTGARGRHSRQEVIEATDDDGLPRRVRQHTPAPLPSGTAGATDGTSEGSAVGSEVATQGDEARSPEQIQAMMSSFQAGLIRGRRAADEDDVTDPTESGQTSTSGESAAEGVAREGQPGTGTATVEAT
jgi:hypothetical protein